MSCIGAVFALNPRSSRDNGRKFLLKVAKGCSCHLSKFSLYIWNFFPENFIKIIDGVKKNFNLMMRSRGPTGISWLT